jgi:hypothetical protein
MDRQILTFSAANIVTVNLMVFLMLALLAFGWRFLGRNADA